MKKESLNPVKVTAMKPALKNLFLNAAVTASNKRNKMQSAYDNMVKQPGQADAAKFVGVIVDRALAIAELNQVKEQYHAEGGIGFFDID